MLCCAGVDLGKWYQVYDNLLEQASFENHSYCDTAQYTAQADGTIGVRNWERQYNSTGSVRVIGGWAKCPQGKPPACTVHLSGVPVPAPYYIVALGPVLEQTYQWAVVSDPFGASLFVLARDPDTFFQQYNADVLQYLQANGFKGLKAPLRIVHKSDCNYQWGN